MSINRTTVAAACVLSLAAALALPAARAGEVKMYDRVPTVEELNAAFAKGEGAVPAPRAVKFRKLEFGDAAPAGEPAATTASAPPAPAADAVGFPINFGYNSAEISPESRGYIDVVGQLMSKRPDMRMTVEGHTDAAGPDSYNQDLSARRAMSVKRYLVNSHGVDPARLEPVGKGESEPLYRDNPLNPKNRRVQFRPAG